jgi:NAD(P)H-flavin reductase
MLEPAQHEAQFYIPKLARVVTSEPMTEQDAYFELEFKDGRPLGHAPGQFVQVSVLGYGEAPISICSAPSSDEPRFALCVRSVGDVSSALHRLELGDWVGIRGPFGRGFPLQQMQNGDVVCVAGGIGLPPLRSLIEHIRARREDYGRLIVVYGAKTPADVLFKEDLERWEDDSGMEFFVTVDEPDDTWRGRSGVVTLPLRELEFDAERPPLAVSVGPPVMYKFVVMELLGKQVPRDRIFLSLERHFKCGIGKCGHCQINDLYVCQHGPVFPFSELQTRTEAVEAWSPEEDQD